jgi:pseudouridine-5'-phosphate glycosidase
MNQQAYMDISPDVQAALAEKKPVVALESTIICHGMPYPENIETALQVEDVIRNHGAVPATIAVIEGRIKVGLSKEQIEYLATAENVRKLSRRDLPAVVSDRADGATTVAGTMIIAAMAGIKLFVTGGIGGVHRGAGESFDISADLEELKNTDVTVVCAGCKSILDIPATLEYLETAGVPVISYAADEFPAFYSVSSGFPSPMRSDSPDSIAKMIAVKRDLGLRGGTLIACPVPKEQEIPSGEIDDFIQTALGEAAKEGIAGSRVTPYLLQKVVDLSGGRALETNRVLVLNNAAVGAKIALALSQTG